MPSNAANVSRCCSRRKTFCCCCSVRTGASVVGWFNFIFNSLYVGMMVFSLAQVSDEVSVTLKSFEKAKSEYKANTSHSFATPKLINNTAPVVESSGTQVSPLADVDFSYGCFLDGKRFEDFCVCDKTFVIPVTETIICSNNIADCRCIMDYVSDHVLPVLYKSLAIPVFLLIASVLWLTAVESGSMLYVRAVGYCYIVAIFLQTLIQIIFLAFYNQKLLNRNMRSLAWPVWTIFAIYAALNLYFIPVLYKYLKLRSKESSQGIDQGLLTSETEPVQSRQLDVYLEDAFAIDSDGELDVFRYSADQSHADYGTADERPVVTTRSH